MSVVSNVHMVDFVKYKNDYDIFMTSEFILIYEIHIKIKIGAPPFGGGVRCEALSSSVEFTELLGQFLMDGDFLIIYFQKFIL